MLWAGRQKVKPAMGGSRRRRDHRRLRSGGRIAPARPAGGSGQGRSPARRGAPLGRAEETRAPRTPRIASVISRREQTAAALVLTPILKRKLEKSRLGFHPGRSADQALATDFRPRGWQKTKRPPQRAAAIASSIEPSRSTRCCAARSTGPSPPSPRACSGRGRSTRGCGGSSRRADPG